MVHQLVDEVHPCCVSVTSMLFSKVVGSFRTSFRFPWAHLSRCSSSLTLLLLIISSFPIHPNSAVVLVSHGIHLSSAFHCSTLVLISSCLVPFSSAHGFSINFQKLPAFQAYNFPTSHFPINGAAWVTTRGLQPPSFTLTRCYNTS